MGDIRYARAATDRMGEKPSTAAALALRVGLRLPRELEFGQERLERWLRAAELSNTELESWMVATLDAAANGLLTHHTIRSGDQRVGAGMTGVVVP